MVSIAFMERRCERLFEDADAISEEISNLPSWGDEEAKKARHMHALYREATAISMCLSAFENERDSFLSEVAQ